MAIWEKLFSKITFKNYPNTSTPINADNLNKMTDAIDGIDDRVVELNSKLESQGLPSNFAITSAVVKIEYLDGATLIGVATLDKHFNTAGMFVFAQAYGDYNTKRFTIVTEKTSSNQVTIIARADNGTEFITGEHIYVDVLVYGLLN